MGDNMQKLIVLAFAALVATGLRVHVAEAVCPYD